jgi:hypothetical protein
VPTFDVQALSASRYDATTLVNQPDAHDNQPLLELDYPIVIDTGASVSVTPNPDDFTEGIRTSTMTELKGLNDVTTVQGYGPVNWTIYDSNDVVRTIRTTAFYVPEASIRLFSPQSYFQEVNGGSLLVDKDKAILSTRDGDLVFPHNCCMNLPLMLPASHKQSKTVGVFREDIQELLVSTASMMSVADETNQNITATQKELLLWHWKLGHCNFQWVQALAAKPRTQDAKPLLLVKLPGVSSTVPPKCTACQLAKQSRRGAKSSTEFKLEDRDMILKSNDLQPGDCVSIDQYQSTVKGRLPHTRGKEKPDEKFNGGTLFVDHASGFIFVRHQVSLRSGETIVSKRAFERFATRHGVKIKHYRADNQPFGSQEFRESIDLSFQTLTFSGSGAHHQNGVAERAIQTTTKWARAMLLHHILHWPEAANLELWPFAFEHAVYLWNHIPRKDIKLSPIELFTGAKAGDVAAHLARMHVWGCPTYVLDPKLQNGDSLPKWDPRVRRGVFLGYSDQHSSTVGLILNIDTGYVTTQFHCVYDDLYTTVPNAETGGLLDVATFDAASWDRIVHSGLEHVFEGEDDVPVVDNWPLPADDLQVPVPLPQPPVPVPLDLPPVPVPNRSPARNAVVDDAFVPVPTPGSPPPDDTLASPSPAVRERRAPTIPVPTTPAPILRSPKPRSTAPVPTQDRRVRFNDVTPRNLIDELVEEFIVPELPEEVLQPPTTIEKETVEPRRSTRVRRPPTKFQGDNWATRYANQKVRTSVLNEQYLQSLMWDPNTTSYQTQDWKAMSATIDRWSDDEGYVDWLHPMALAAKANSADNPTWNEAMNGPNCEGYWEAMATELETLAIKKQAWEVVERESWMNVLPSTWAFKCKRYPDGLVKKLKARFCVRGDRQREGVDFFETFAPVVSWTTVRLMLILSLVLDLATRQVDYTAAFLHADIDRDPNYDLLTPEEQRRSGVYVEMPRGFSEPGKVLKLKKSLYGLKQAPRNFFQHLKSKLEKIGFVSSESDACLFIGMKVICIVYVDDTLLFSPKAQYIDEVLQKLRE